MGALLTDLYELTMAAGFVAEGKHRATATFELFARRLPGNRKFLVAAGLQQALEYLQGLRFTSEEIAYLRGLVQFAQAPEEFLTYLEQFRCTGDVFAVAEGTPMFPGEPLLTVRAPLVEAQIIETYLLSMVGFQTMIASKAARVVAAAKGRSVVEFGTRRAHSPQAGTLAPRAAYIGGCAGTSNTEAGLLYGVPVYGTAAHSWVQSFSDETAAFRALQKLMGESTVHLIDTYDTLEGARRAAAVGRPMWGVRIDSGDLGGLSREVRKILDAAGLADAKIMVSGDLTEQRVRALADEDAPVDAIGVGTDLATSGDAPNLSVVYKLVEIEEGSGKRYTFKKSAEKSTLPGAKQVFRKAGGDVIGCASECSGCGEVGPVEALLWPVMLRGQILDRMPPVGEARQRAQRAIAALPAAVRSLDASDEVYPVTISEELRALDARVKA
ncbi:MAG: nicotinate phosphoribosyltransferase [Bryobacterales bacterium]|nr:nicotinate phosphoribosyltransferase [Bryobacterales bacterium]